MPINKVRMIKSLCFTYILLFLTIHQVINEHFIVIYYNLSLSLNIVSILIIGLVIIYQLLKLPQAQNILNILSISILIQSFIPFDLRGFGNYFYIFLIVSNLYSLLIISARRKIKDKYFIVLGYLLLATFFIRSVQTIYLYASIYPQKRLHHTLQENIESLKLHQSQSSLPNIYHIIFDYLPSRPIPDFLKEENETNRGLTNFPNALTDYATTQHSVQSVYLSRTKHPDESIEDYLAYGESELHDTPLKQFRNYGYKVITNNLFTSHKFKSRIDSFYYQDAYFDHFLRKLIYRYQYLYWNFAWTLFPANISNEHGIFVGSDPLSILKELTYHKALLSVFKNPKFKKTGQAFFLYLKTPHPPFVQDSDCKTSYPFITYYDQETSRSCAHKMIEDTIKTIKEIHPDGNYYLAIHSDHGDFSNRGLPFLLTNFHNEKDSFITNYSMVKIRHILSSMLYHIKGEPENDNHFPVNRQLIRSKEPFIYQDLNTMEILEVKPEDLINYDN